MAEKIRHNRNIALLIDADNASPKSLEAALTILGDLGTDLHHVENFRPFF